MTDKRAHLVAVAFELFYSQGIHAVGINRVLAESGVAKKTLYRYFASKEDLIAATLEYRDQSFYAWLSGRMAQAGEGRSAVLEMFDALDDWFNNRVSDQPAFNGCFFVNASAEFGAADHALHQLCAAHKKRIQNLIGHHLALARPVSMSVEQLTRLLVLLKEGAIVQAHVQGEKGAAADARAFARQLLAA